MFFDFTVFIQRGCNSIVTEIGGRETQFTKLRGLFQRFLQPFPNKLQL